MIADFKAFDVLSADINDKIHIRPEFFRCRVVGNGLHQPKINAKRIFDNLFPITSGCRT